jgi:hypothetical protein
MTRPMRTLLLTISSLYMTCGPCVSGQGQDPREVEYRVIWELAVSRLRLAVERNPG